MVKKVTIIIQARQDSTRFKNKILKKINGKEIILNLISRLKKCKKINDIIVAIPNNLRNKNLSNLLKSNNIKIFKGSEKNVLKRYYDCSVYNNIKHILRITSDCPLIDPKIIDQMYNVYDNNDVDYLSNTIDRTFPDGLDAEFFSFKTLKKTYENAVSAEDKEHVTSYIKRTNLFKKKNYFNKDDNSHIRLTLDYKEDLKIIKKFIIFNKKKDFGIKELISFYKKNKNIFIKNSKIINKESLKKKYCNPKIIWQEALDTIAGGNSLFSKRPDVYLPDKWPSYFVRAKGSSIYAVDKKKYLDFSNMGVGTNLLGYANSQVDNAVKKRISKGNMTTLNSLEEIMLAKKLLTMHSWADKARFTRSGGEANSVAIRLSRASTNRQKVAICGYHGWHDWYLAANIKDENSLSDHLLPGLKTDGVYSKLKGSVFTFKYNDFNGLKKIIRNNPEVGIIKMEVIRSEKPKNNFLKKIRKFADEKKLILIFDECTTGFRETFGGIHKIYGVNPDILILGKALGNGYAINAVLGKKEIMDNIYNTFISSTFWTEASGYAAALKTLELMEKKKSWIYVTKLGLYIQKMWRILAKKNQISIKIKGIPALSSFLFKKNNQIYKTLITQEMLKKNILATNSIYISTSHTKKDLQKYFKILDSTFSIIRKCQKGDDIFRYLNSEISISDFKRLN